MSSDNGDNWALTGLSNKNVTELIVLPNGDILAGAYGCYRSTNNGLNWNRIDSTAFPQSGLTAIAKSSTGFLLASSEHLCRSNDNGVSWFLVNEQSFSTIVINSLGYAVGGRNDQNGLYLSTDGGYNWNIMNTGIPNNFYTGILDIDSSGYIYYSTWGSSIFRTEKNTISVSKISNEIPNHFSLSQNYPNPFNPSTKIRFEISGSSVAQTFLSVYDMLGREISTLVNQELKPGTYEVDWNASSYPSGVYFYRIITTNFSETRKMLFIK